MAEGLVGFEECGLIAGIELVRDTATKEPFPWEEKRGLRVCDLPFRDVVAEALKEAWSRDPFDRLIVGDRSEVDSSVVVN